MATGSKRGRKLPPRTRRKSIAPGKNDVAQLKQQLAEARAQQAATAEILRVIGGSMTDTQPVFDSIVENCHNLFKSSRVALWLISEDRLHARASTAEPGVPMPIDRGSAIGVCVLDGHVVHLPDLEKAAEKYPRIRQLGLKHGYRSGIYAPLLREGRALGGISVLRREEGAFDDKEVALLNTFADQAVIAIENVRLFNESKEALERQTATAEILKVISSSPTDVHPVFDAIIENAMRLCDANLGTVGLYDGQNYRHVAQRGGSSEYVNWLLAGPFAPDPAYTLGRMIAERCPVHIPDYRELPEYRRRDPRAVSTAELGGARTFLAVPMLKEGAVVGGITIRRTEVRPFTQKQIDLVSTFASQAVIAIENVRLFNETKEALEQQRATAEVLASISGSMTDTQPVFERIVQNLGRLFGTRFAVLQLLRDNIVEMPAVDGGPEFNRLRERYPRPLDETTVGGRAMLSKQTVQFAPVLDNPATPAATVQFARDFGFNSVIFTPMIHEGTVIGAIGAAHTGAKPFDDRQVALIRSFADQAVIAIQNARLFDETREALERQTATAEILKVISGSPTDTQPVFDAIARNANILCNGLFANVFRFDGELVHLTASTHDTPQATDILRSTYPVRPSAAQVSGRVILSNAIVRMEDALSDPDYDHRFADSGGWRRILGVPMLHEGSPIGAIVVGWAEPGPIQHRHEDLLKTFADQAVIAIENVRLFNETKEALERQTATAEILRVISSTPADTQPVFDAIVDSTQRLIPGKATHLLLRRESNWALAAYCGPEMENLPDQVRAGPMDPERNFPSRAMLDRQVVHVTDWESDDVPEFEKLIGKTYGIRSGLIVPLLRKGEGIGAIAVTRESAGPYHEKEIALLQSFADQAVIAIENVRLFNETKEALERQTATAEILRVISSSPTDTQPVFDAIVQSGLKLFSGAGVGILIVDGGELRIVATAGNLTATAIGIHLPISRESASGMAIVEKRVVNIKDTEAPDAPAHARDNGRRLGVRSMTQAPMFREGEPVGVIGVTLEDPGGLDDKQVTLLKTFADQAVIAIENVRLFKELQQRTEALTKSVGQLTALGEVGQAISSTLDLETVLKTIVNRAMQLTVLDGGVIYEYDEAAERFALRASENFDEHSVLGLRSAGLRKGEGAVGRCVVTREPSQVPDTHAPNYPARLRDLLDRAGFRAVLAVPLLREDQTIGALMMLRKVPGPFAADVVEMLRTFASQSALAIQNARLFREIAEKSKQLEEASKHKSQFLASMSHELRTPLNAILGFNEMILGQVYGEVPADMQEPLADIQTSGKHLLRLINNVLDLAKIEAGRMELSLQDYSVHDTVESVRSTLRPLAAEKGLEFLASVPNDIPLAYGDGGRITQCLMNLAGNSLKFTKAGKVEISVEAKGDLLVYKVADTGIGIPPDKIESLFTEFKQTDATIASEYGGTGLGLSISRKFIEMHGGRIWVESELGKGSAFIFEIPLRANTP